MVGSQLVHFARTDDAVVGEELRAYDPDLIVLAFGTNEGFAPRVSPFEYEIILRTQIGRIRRLAGNVPILLLGAPDALTRRPELLANAPGGDSAPCGETIVAQSPAQSPAAAGGLGQAMTTLGDFLGLTARTEGGQAVAAARTHASAPGRYPGRRVAPAAVPAGGAVGDPRCAAPCRGLSPRRFLGLAGAHGRALHRAALGAREPAADARRLRPLHQGRGARDRAAPRCRSAQGDAAR